MKKNKIIILALLLLGAIGRFIFQDNSHIKAIDFIQIFVIGLLFGLLYLSLLTKFKNKE